MELLIIHVKTGKTEQLMVGKMRIISPFWVTLKKNNINQKEISKHFFTQFPQYQNNLTVREHSDAKLFSRYDTTNLFLLVMLRILIF